MFFSFEVEIHKGGLSYAGTQYVKASSYDQAFYYLKDYWVKAGWEIDFLKGRKISILTAEK